MKKLIVWFTPLNKKITKNQFHVEASTNTEAIELLKEIATFDFNVMGVSNYRGEDNQFINKQIL